MTSAFQYSTLYVSFYFLAFKLFFVYFLAVGLNTNLCPVTKQYNYLISLLEHISYINYLFVTSFSPTFSSLIVGPRRCLRTSPFYRFIFFTTSTRDHSPRATWKGRQVLDRSTGGQQPLRRTNSREVCQRSLGNLSQVIDCLRLLLVSFFFFLAFLLSLSRAKR